MSQLHSKFHMHLLFCPQGGLCPAGLCPGGLRHLRHGQTPSIMVGEWTVRIILECILVLAILLQKSPIPTMSTEDFISV